MANLTRRQFLRGGASTAATIAMSTPLMVFFDEMMRRFSVRRSYHFVEGRAQPSLKLDFVPGVGWKLTASDPLADVERTLDRMESGEVSVVVVSQPVLDRFGEVMFVSGDVIQNE